MSLRNLPLSPKRLASLIDIRPGRVVSMALSRSEGVQMTLLAFGAGESVSEESYPGDMLYIVLEGEMPLAIGEEKHLLSAGMCMMVPAGALHAIGGTQAFKLLQISVADAK